MPVASSVPIDLEAAVQDWLAQPGPALLDVVTSRMELVMPPFVGPQQVFGTALYSAKAILGGRAGDVWDLVSGESVSPSSPASLGRKGVSFRPRPERRHVLAGLEWKIGGALFEERLDALLRVGASREVAHALQVERHGVEGILGAQHAPHQSAVDRGRD